MFLCSKCFCTSLSTLENLTKKLCTLLAILSGSRCQTIVSLDLDHCHINENQTQLTFYISKVLKNTKPGHHQAPLEFLVFPGNEKWCPIDCFLEYTKRTQMIRENSNPGVMKGLLILRNSFLQDAGVDTDTFSAHSTQHASTSAAVAAALPLKDVIKAGGWHTEHSFQRHYKLPVKNNFGNALLMNSIL